MRQYPGHLPSTPPLAGLVPPPRRNPRSRAKVVDPNRWTTWVHALARNRLLSHEVSDGFHRKKKSRTLDQRLRLDRSCAGTFAAGETASDCP